MKQVIGSYQDRLRRQTTKRARTSGQTLVLVPPVLFVITIFFCIMYNVSWYAKKRVALQEAADSAALAGARVQGMMLEGIAVGNDAIAVNAAQILKDIAESVDLADAPAAIADIVKRLTWTIAIRSTQDALTGLSAPLFTASAASLAAPASGADFAFVLPPASSNVFGYTVPTQSSDPSTNVTRPWWGALGLFMLRNSATPGVPAQFPITEKPIVVAFSNLAGDLALPIPLSSVTIKIPNSQGVVFTLDAPYLVATSASAPYFIPENRPDDRAGDLIPDPQYALLRELSLMIPGPFWGARLDQVGEQQQGVADTSGGWAIWAGKFLITKFGIPYIKKNYWKLVKKFEETRTAVEGESEQELDSIVAGDQDEVYSDDELEE